MDPADEALIQKFAQLHTEANNPSTKIVIAPSGATSKNWSLCLKALVCTDRMVFSNQFENQMRKLWDVSQETSFKQTAKGTYLIQCTGKKDWSKVLNGGPWVYRQDLVAIDQCDSAEKAASEILHGELWVQFHNLQSDDLTEEGFQALTSPIGVPLSDPVTGFINGKQFFKIKMQVPLNKPLKDKVFIEHPNLGDIFVHTVYEKIGRVCRFCGLLGHEMDGCPDRIALARLKSAPANIHRQELRDILKPTLGLWIISPAMVPNDASPSAQQNSTKNQEESQPPAQNADANTGLKRTLSLMELSTLNPSNVQPKKPNNSPKPKKFAKTAPQPSLSEHLIATIFQSPPTLPQITLTSTTDDQLPGGTPSKKFKAASMAQPPSQ